MKDAKREEKDPERATRVGSFHEDVPAIAVVCAGG